MWAKIGGGVRKATWQRRLLGKVVNGRQGPNVITYLGRFVGRYM